MLFNSDYSQIKLCDFGVSNKVEFTKDTTAATAGSLRYMPPEQFDNQLNLKIDILSLGCIIIQMLTGRLPYSDLKTEFKIMRVACS